VCVGGGGIIIVKERKKERLAKEPFSFGLASEATDSAVGT